MRITTIFCTIVLATTMPRAVLAQSDPLTIDSAKQVTAAYNAIEAAIKKDSTLALPKPITKIDQTTLLNHIKAQPALVSALAKAGFTPDSYASQWMRIRSAWGYAITERYMAIQLGASMAQVSGLVKPPMPDIIFAREHGEDLKALGFPEPATPKWDR